MLNRLKKLRRQFILTNMILVGLMIAVVFVSVCVISYRTARRNIYTSLSDAISDVIRRETEDRSDPLPPQEDFTDDDSDSRRAMTSFLIFTASVSADGEITVYDDNGSGKEFVLSRAAAILGEEKSKNVLLSKQMIYSKRTYEGSTYLAFCPDEPLQTTSRLAFFIAAGAAGAMLLFLYVICRILAGIAIRPVETAWTSQEQFIADASHDLKTPLTVILADAELLRGGLAAGKADPRWIDGIREEAERMRTMVEKMLELARTDQLKGALTFVATDLSDLSEQAILQLEPIAFDRNVILEQKIRPHVEYPTDPETFTRLLYILIENAVKYTPSGEKIRVSLRTEKQYIRLTVENPGSISEEDIAHIFERFYRADKARTVGGSGLGLSIAKNLAEALGGELKAESAGGKTAFILRFRRQFLSELADATRAGKKNS